MCVTSANITFMLAITVTYTRVNKIMTNTHYDNLILAIFLICNCPLKCC